ncbi:HAD family hydrolase [Conexibacter arvalis]|uniref:Phosphoglycolate phosphatase-like HAD superfamily hydrolase n=1 Tax=Conexibacter arvalis TaxID=912552 RepID=A0A840IE72_9ACTN|nr:haloacid dehalogenase-like hydrolase [Conexibacter arvalis]MBB4663287.1 phosphoglycolate phosphatase-like HAD superfamily hydrolase [Conexibacter arvalis]
MAARAADVTDGAAPLLLLFDIDGTLLAGATEAHAAALVSALREVHGLPAVRSTRDLGIDPSGRTDPEIARLILLAHDVSAERIDARADAVREACCAEYARTCPPDLSAFVIPGVPELLARLAGREEELRLALVTGNYEPVARVKLRSAGVGHWFASGQGGFGSDSEDRTDLPGVARARAGGAVARAGRAEAGAGSEGADRSAHPRDRTVVIGDTPRDVACAHADGVRCIAVTTGRFSAAEFEAAGADAVASDALQLEAAIDALT